MGLQYSQKENKDIPKGGKRHLAKTYTRKELKTYSVIMKVLSILLIILSSFLYTVAPAPGVLGVAIGVFMFVLGRKYKKIAQTSNNDTIILGKGSHSSTTSKNASGSEEAAISEIQEKNQKYRNSLHQFSTTYGCSHILKWKYYDVYVTGCQFQNINYDTIQLGSKVSFVKEPDNQYDPKAIKVMLGNSLLGYLKKDSQMQDMVNNYLENDDYYVLANINDFDKEKKQIQLQIAFYKQFDEDECPVEDKLVCSIVKSSKKDFYGESRQDNYLALDSGDFVSLSVNYESDGEDTYIVENESGGELGEISAKQSEKIRSYDAEGKEMICRIKEVTENPDSGKYGAKVEVFILE